MSARHRVITIVLATAALAGASACTSTSPGTGGASAGGTSPTTSANAVSSTPSSSSTSPSSSSAEPTLATPAPRTAANLQKALLTLDDLPSGFAIEPDEPPAPEDAITFSSKDPRCKPLIDFLNANAVLGATATAGAYYSTDPSEPGLSERLGAMGSAHKASANIAALKTARDACPKVSAKGTDGTASISILAVKAPAFGTDTMAFRVQGKAPLDYVIGTVVVTHADDIMLELQFDLTLPGDLEAGTELALSRMNKVLGVGGDKA